MVQRPGLGVDAAGDGSAPVAFVPQGLEQGQDELAPALAGQEFLRRGDRRLIAVGQGDLQPGEGQFAVALVRQVQGALQIRQLGGGQPVGVGGQALWAPAEETLALLGVPLRPRNGGGRSLVLEEGHGGRIDRGEGVRHRRHGVGRQAGLIDPGVQLQFGFQSRVALHQMGADVLQEHGRGHRPIGVAVEIAAQPGVEPLPARDPLDGAQEGRALVIGDGVHAVVGIAASQVEMQAGVGGGQGFQLVLQPVPAQNLFLHRPVMAVDRLHDPVLEIGGETLVQPEVVPGGVGDQIAGPGVGQFVRHQRDQRLVAGDDGRGGEGQFGVFHPAEREGRRQEQQVIPAPAIGAVQFLGRVHHFGRRLKLGGGGAQAAGLGPDPGPLVEGREGDVADADGDQIGRDRIVHPEAPGLHSIGGGLALGRQLVGAHDHGQVGRGGDAGRIGLADAGAALGRNPGAGQDGLALAEQIGLLAARRLGRAQPLQGRRVGTGRIADGDFAPFIGREGREIDGN